MAKAEDETPADVLTEAPARRRKRVLAMWLLLAALAISILAAWLSREKIADNIIADQLEGYGLHASYTVERVGGTRQEIANLVIGDPKRPDFTAERVAVILRYRWGFPAVGRIELVRPRLFGTYREGKLTFGSLDKVIFRETGEPPALPDIDLKLVDGRGLLDTEYGPVGLKLEGEGELDSGFAGIVAASAPALAVGDCAAGRTTLFGKLTTRAGRPKFDGPLRLASLACPDRHVALKEVTIDTVLTGEKDLSGFEAKGRLASGDLTSPWASASGANGNFDAAWRNERLNLHYSLAARGLVAEQVTAAVATVEGSARASDRFSRVEVQSDLEGNGLRVGNGLQASLAGFEKSASDTLLVPLLRQVRMALDREARASSFSAGLTFRRNGETTSLVVPEARLRGGSGQTLLALSQVQFAIAEGAGARLAGNFSTGGQAMPRVVGRMERRETGEPMFRLRMTEYTAGASSLSIPELLVVQSPTGQIGFSGSVEASGPLPGGSARRLALPVSGNWSANGGLAMWRSCTKVAFDRLVLANLALEGKGLTLCPGSGGAILRSNGAGLRIAAGAPSLDLSGQLGDTPIAIRSGPVGFAYPGAMSAKALDIALGPAGSGTSFRITNLDARLGKDIAGTFAEADVRLHAVPLDMLDASGNWRYAKGRLEIADGNFRLLDRQAPARFEPLVSRDARLALENGVITAFAELRQPKSDRVVTSAEIRHDLGSGKGHVDLAVPGIKFDERLQPEDLSHLALGIIANAEGTVTGKGRIDWVGDNVTSSGDLTTEGLDFAAAFGPVKGANGTIHFTDLLNLTTAPGQKLRIASINPGIEVFDGEVEFTLRDSTRLVVAGGTWPFLGGTLIFHPVDINFGANEVRRYVLEIHGLDAAQFIQRMELANLSATGTFDGMVPIVFDESGTGRIDRGLLIARPPGGNISYVGELTYEDLSPIANYTFATLRSLDYREMSVIMNGPLTGEIVTEVEFDGIRQGTGARSNFITKRLANLPIRFKVNIKAAFYQLITDIKSMYDPTYVRDPRDLGLLTDDGKRFRPVVRGEDAEAKVTPQDIIPDEPPIQSPESEKMP